MKKSDRSRYGVPAGIEVLLKKASVDEDFGLLLEEDPLAAARAIGLALSTAERSILEVLDPDQIRKLVARVEVPVEHRRTFRTGLAAAMLGLVAGAGLIAGTADARKSPTSPPTPMSDSGIWTLEEL